MRVASPLLTRLWASAIGRAIRVWSVLSMRLRWPRFTTRRLMLLVAIVALLIWAVQEVPRMIDRTIFCNRLADAQAASERDYRGKARTSRAGAIRAEFDQVLIDMEEADQLTERYFAARRESEELNSRYYDYVADSYKSLAGNRGT
jgi:hypothetical protein